MRNLKSEAEATNYLKHIRNNKINYKLLKLEN